tara:strand:+ start:701 stop:1852 length:1152 start_codon:yes stop_codon:yes gene_type:complete
MSEKVVKISPVTESKDRSVQVWLKEACYVTREVLCPVRTHYHDNGKEVKVIEYAMPIDIIERDKHTQPRKQGKDQRKVASIADSFISQGQDEGVCVELVHQKDGTYKIYVRWGSHRLEATELLKLRNDQIKGLPVGYIWVNIYRYQRSELRKLQSIENNLSKPKQMASEADNLATLEAEAASGNLDIYEDGNLIKFADMCEDLQREQLEKYIVDYMPAYTQGKKKSALITKFYDVATNPYKSDTLSKREAIEYFNIHNAMGLKFTVSTAKIPVVTDKDGVRHKLLITTQNIHKGAQLQSTMNQRLSNDFDKVHCVMTLDRSMLKDSATMKTSRKEGKSAYETWHKNASKVKVVDHIYFPPQSDPEKKSAKANCKPWVDKHDYK